MSSVRAWPHGSGWLKRRRSLLVVVTVVTAALAGGFGTFGQGVARGDGTSAVKVTLSNFRIDAPAAVHAGVVRFVVTGAGPSMHELNVARTDLEPDRLPSAADGTVDDQEPHPNFVHVAEVEGIDIGQHKTLSVRLRPGTYVLYCNMDGHYLAGMVARLRVIP